MTKSVLKLTVIPALFFGIASTSLGQSIEIVKTSVTNILCTGDTTGVANFVIIGGEPAFTAVCHDVIDAKDAGFVSITNRNIAVSKLYAGKFAIELTDADGETAYSDEFEVAAPLIPFSYLPNSNDATCFGSATGKIFGEATGGQLPYLYSIRNIDTPYTAGNNTGMFTDLPTGRYIATVTDYNGCKQTADTITIGSPEEITVADPEKKPAATVVCSEDKSASVKFTVKGRTEFVDPADTATYYSVKLFYITEQYEMPVSDYKQSNKFHPVLRKTKYCEEEDPETGETKTVPCGWDTLFKQGCHEPSIEYPIDSLGFDCDDYITVSGLGKGAYRIEFYRGACTLGAFKEFTVEQTGDLPKTVHLNATNPVCDGSSMTVSPEIEANPAITKYVWTLGGINVGTAKDFEYLYTLDDDKRVLQLEATNQCGSVKSNELQISVLPRPSAILDAGKKFLCEGDSTDITIQFKGTAPFNFTYPGGDESTINVVETRRIVPTQTASYTLTALSDANCTAIIEEDVTPTYITIYPQQTVDLDVTVPTPMVSGRFVTLTATPGFVSYTFDMNDGILAENQTDNTCKVKKFPYGTTTNSFGVKVTESNSCVWNATASEVITVDKFPNIFTPNGDGVNDIFLADYYIEVFDRWGTLIYSGDNGWDGKHNGKFVNPGVYLYVVKLIDQNNEEVTIKSTVTVER